MNRRLIPAFARLFLALALTVPALVRAEDEVEAGKIIMLTGQATALGNDGRVRKLSKSDPVYAGDLVNSGIGSYVNIRFLDGAYFLLRPETRFHVEQYEYPASAPPSPGTSVQTAPATAPPPSSSTAPLVTATQTQTGTTSRAFFRLLKGGFRSVSGLIGKINHDDYRVVTPVATIGIRGTVYSARLCQGFCEDRDQITALLRGAGQSSGGNETVLVTTVDEGEIAVKTLSSNTLQAAGSVAFTTDDGKVTPVKEAPQTEKQEQSLDPKSCGS